MQHCAIFCNRKNAKGREPKNTGQEPGLKGLGSGRFKSPCSPPPTLYLLELFKGYNMSFFQELSHTNLENPRFLKESMKLN